MVNSRIYINIAVNAHVQDVLSRLIDKISNSGLYDHVERIELLVNGDINQLSLPTGEKYVISHPNLDTTKCEFPTLDKLWEDSQTEDINVLYLHTKGVFRKPTSIPIRNWTEYMSYFTIERWRDVLPLLSEYESAGVNRLKHNKLMLKQLKQSEQAGCTHYSGNFWWARSSYIKNLPRPSTLVYNDDYILYRYIAEAWIGINFTPENSKVLYRSGKNHYVYMFPRKQYEGKPFLEE